MTKGLMVVLALCSIWATTGCVSPERMAALQKIHDYGGACSVETAYFGPSDVSFGNSLSESDGRVIDDADFAELFPSLLKLPEIERLDFWKSQITDRSVPLLLRLRGMKVLGLCGTRISAEGLQRLTYLPKIKSISVPVKWIGEAELKAIRDTLKVARPMLEIDSCMEPDRGPSKPSTAPVTRTSSGPS